MVTQTLSEVNSNNSSQNSAKYTFNENLNVEFLNKTYGENLSFCEKMFGIFLSTTDADMITLMEYIQHNNYEAVRALSHKIKNNFTWVGLPKLSKMMYDLENMARKQGSLNLNFNITHLQKSYSESLKYVKNEYENLRVFTSQNNTGV